MKDKQYRLGIELDEHTKADHEYHIHVATVLHLAQKTKEIFESSRQKAQLLLENPLQFDTGTRTKSYLYKWAGHLSMEPFEAGHRKGFSDFISISDRRISVLFLYTLIVLKSPFRQTGKIPPISTVFGC